MHPCLLISLKPNKLKLTQYVHFKSYYKVLLKCILKICLNAPGSVGWSDSYSEFSAPLLTWNCHCHYSGQCHGAQRVRDVPQEYGKCVDKKPVTCDYGDIFKACAQAKAIQKKECNICLQRRSTELLLALKERLWAGYMSWDPLGTIFSTRHLTQTDSPPLLRAN